MAALCFLLLTLQGHIPAYIDIPQGHRISYYDPFSRDDAGVDLCSGPISERDIQHSEVVRYNFLHNLLQN